ncbi:VOC family protein [Virgibacillus flavescens]|uniref:VOC family protein n=1 Tax=Virgibacillus flavescens TaxID=1611422 RepID=UPI003D340063
MIKGIYPYLIMNGNGQKAIKFYEEAVKAEVLNVQTFADMPENPEMPIPDEAKNLVMNAHLKVGGTDLMLSDTFPGQPYQIGEQVTIAITMTEETEAREIFDKLKVDGKIGMHMQETFWSQAYGQVTDKFNVTWHVSAEPENI